MRANAHALYSALLSDLRTEIDVTLPGWAPDSTPCEAACFALRDSLLKKFNDADRPEIAATTAALEKFLAVNKRCAGYRIPYEFSQDEQLIGGVKAALHAFWYQDEERSDNRYAPIVSDYREVYLLGRAGPGASVKARATDFYTKMMDSSLTCTTEDLAYVWQRCVSMNELTLDAERFRDKLHGTTVVDGNKLSFVNKTTTIARGICTEPSINMWMQLGVGRLLENRLERHFGIDIRGSYRNPERPWDVEVAGSQPYVNRTLARVGSVTGRFCTIDLESASDSFAIDMMHEICPRSMMNVLMSLRSPTTALPSGERVVLNMVSTMGNGFTFPMMTAVFCAVVQSVYRHLGLPLKGKGQAESRNFAVFGDDIIVVPEAQRLVLRTLHLLGFVVNRDKTFIEGRFRESCGADYIDGINIRGVYVKRMRSPQDLFVAINGLNRWSTRLGISLSHTVAYLVNRIRNFHRCFVPPDEDDAAGIHVPASFLERSKQYPHKGNGTIGYTAHVPRKWEFYVLGGVCWTYKAQVKRNYNPSGLLIAFLAGGVRGYAVSLRQRKIVYTTKRRWTPRWDYLPPRPWEDPLGSSRSKRFVDACARNLSGCGVGAAP